MAPELHGMSRSHIFRRIKAVAFHRGLLTIRNSAKAFVRTPGLSLVLLLTIALGVGSNVTVFGFVQGLIHPSLPQKDDERIVSIFAQDKTHSAGPLTRREFQLLRSHSGPFVWIEGARIAPVDVWLGDHSQTAMVAAIMPNLAGALGLPQNGGVFISRRVRDREFGNSVNVVGQRIRVNKIDLPITGIAADQLEGLYRDQIVDLWTPFETASFPDQDQESRDVWALARIRDGVSMGEAQRSISQRLGNSDGIYVAPFSGASPTMASGLSQIGTMLEFASIAVFLVACCVVASLLLGRALRRIRVMSINVALGATRRDLMMELLSDCIVVSLAGGALGLLLAMGTAHVLPSLLFAEDAERLVFAPRLSSIFLSSFDCVGIIILCGFVPILATTTDRPWNVMQRESGFPSAGVARFRTILVVLQITTCCVLTIFSTVLFERFHALIRTTAGHGAGNLILATVQAQPGLLDDTNYFKAVEQTVRSTPNVSPLAWTTLLPGTPPAWRSFRVHTPTSSLRDVQFDIAGLTSTPYSSQERLLWGRPFGIQARSCHVAVVDEEAAAELFGPDTLGMTIQEPDGAPVEIVGAVKRASGDSKDHRHSPTIYYTDSNSLTRGRIAGVRFRAPVTAASTSIEMNTNIVSPDYLRALGLSLVAGQWFPDHEIAGGCRHLGVINQEAADLYFGGRALSAAVIDDGGVRTEIIGIVTSQPLGTFEQHAEPAIYFPMWQEDPGRRTLLIRTSMWNQQMMVHLRDRIHSVPENAPASPVLTTLDTRLAESGFAPLRIARLIFATSTLTALLLSIVGLLSVQSDTERQRRRELAVRIALGAQRRHIFFLTIKEIGKLAFAGILVGTLISAAALRIFTRELSTIGSPPFQVWLLAPILSMLMLILTATVAGFRALSGEPQSVMREDG
jgi:ABC-type antimicrobial peptide transport system permease subunit